MTSYGNRNIGDYGDARRSSLLPRPPVIGAERLVERRFLLSAVRGVCTDGHPEVHLYIHGQAMSIRQASSETYNQIMNQTTDQINYFRP